MNCNRLQAQLALCRGIVRKKPLNPLFSLFSIWVWEEKKMKCIPLTILHCLFFPLPISFTTKQRTLVSFLLISFPSLSFLPISFQTHKPLLLTLMPCLYAFQRSRLNAMIASSQSKEYKLKKAYMYHIRCIELRGLSIVKRAFIMKTLFGWNELERKGREGKEIGRKEADFHCLVGGKKEKGKVE